MKSETAIEEAEQLPLIPEAPAAAPVAPLDIGWRVYVFMVAVFAAKGFNESFPALATSYFTKDDLGMSPSTATMVGSLVVIPWTIKPLYGFFTDNFPIAGMQRVPYIAITFMVVSACWFVMAYGVNSVMAYVLVVFISNTAMAAAFVCGEAVVVEHSDAGCTESSNTLQTVVWGSSMVGATIGGMVGNAVEALASTKLVFTLTAAVPLLALPFIWQQSVERPRDASQRQSIGEYFGVLWDTAKQPQMLKPAIFILLFQMSPSMGSTGFYYYTNHLGMSKDVMAVLGSVTQVCGLVGMALYYFFFRNLTARPVMFWGVLGVNLLTSTQLLLFTGVNQSLGIPDEAFVFADSALITVAGTVLMVPLLSLMAQLCPKGLEGTVFSFYTALYNLGGIISAQLSGLLQDAFGITATNFDNIVWLRILTLILQTMPIFLLFLLPEVQEQPSAAAPEALVVTPVVAEPLVDANGLMVDANGLMVDANGLVVKDSLCGKGDTEDLRHRRVMVGPKPDATTYQDDAQQEV